MANAEVGLDLMELADLGQPLKLAHEIHRQLRAQFGSVPTKVPLAGIAAAVGIEVIDEHDNEAIEGMLAIMDGRGAVSLRRTLRAGRRNFTLGHEIGHFVIPNHRFQSAKFQCAKRDIGQERGAGNWAQRPVLERIEVEANEFAAALLVPRLEFRAERRKLGTAYDVAHIRALAETFAVSQEVMAKVYVQEADESIAIVTSQNGLVRRVIPKQGFPYLGLRRDMPLPVDCLTRRFTVANDPISNLVELPAHVWVDQSRGISALYEQVFVQEEGWAMTLIAVDEEQDDDEDDDRDWNRRSGRW